MVSLNEGDKAPKWDLVVEGSKALALSDFVGQNVVLYFYPKDDTPGCTQEAKDFRDYIKRFQALNTVVIGVSKDDLASHAKFSNKCGLPFVLASDLEGKTCHDYGVWVEKSMYGKKYFGIERSTFLLDDHGGVRKVWRKVSVPDHVVGVLKEVERLEKK